MKKDIKNIPAPIRAKLQNKARETHRPFAEVLQYFGMEKFLYRLSCSEYVNQFILKGALMFTVWNVSERRSTLDIDFLARFDNQITSIEKMVKDVCKIKVVPDGLVFDPETVKGQRIKKDTEYDGTKLTNALRKTFAYRKTELPEGKKLFAKEIKGAGLAISLFIFTLYFF